jgi:hypothetical protein
MPFPAPTLEAAAKDNTLKLLMQAYMKKAFADESFDFYFSKANNQVLYHKYVKQGAPDQVNLPSSARIPLDKLAQAGQWGNMDAPMKKAREAIAAMVRNDVLSRFVESPEYIRWAVVKYKKSSDDGVKATNLLAKELTSSKNLATLKALMQVVEGGRTPADRKKAYVAIQGLVKKKEKVPTIFKSAGLVVPR